MAEATTLWRQAIGLILGLKSRNKRAFSTRRNLLFSAEAAVILTSVSFLYTNLKKKKIMSTHSVRKLYSVFSYH